MKHYETPAVGVILAARSTFLEVSGEATATDIFGDKYGKDFGENS